MSENRIFKTTSPLVTARNVFDKIIYSLIDEIKAQGFDIEYGDYVDSSQLGSENYIEGRLWLIKRDQNILLPFEEAASLNLEIFLPSQPEPCAREIDDIEESERLEIMIEGGEVEEVHDNE